MSARGSTVFRTATFTDCMMGNGGEESPSISPIPVQKPARSRDFGVGEVGIAKMPPHRRFLKPLLGHFGRWRGRDSKGSNRLSYHARYCFPRAKYKPGKPYQKGSLISLSTPFVSYLTRKKKFTLPAWASVPVLLNLDVAAFEFRTLRFEHCLGFEF